MSKAGKWICVSCSHRWIRKVPWWRGFRRPLCPACGGADVLVCHWDTDQQWREWLKLQAEVFRRDSYTCRVCGAKTGSNPKVHPLDPDRMDELDALVTLCPDCHCRLHGETFSHWLGNWSLVLGIVGTFLGLMTLEVAKIFAFILISVSVVLILAGLGMTGKQVKIRENLLAGQGESGP